MSDPKKELYRDGLTIRDHFAGRALQALIAAAANRHGTAALDDQDSRRALAGLAYKQADAMMKVRAEK